MKDTKEIVLFFKKNTNYNTMEVAKEIVNRYKELGDPIIIPEMDNKNNPLIIFNANKDFQIETNYLSVTIVVHHQYYDKLPTIVFDIIDTFEEFKCSFYRIGYLSNIFLSPKYVEKSKKRFLKLDHLQNIEDYNLSWYKKLTLKNGYINVWERFITDDAHFKDLLCQYDFNTPQTENINLDMKFIKEFLNVCDNYIEERTSF